MSRWRRAAPQYAEIQAVMATVVASMPIFLVGALAVQLRSAFDISGETLGSAISMSYLAAAVTSIPVGRLTDWLGALWMMRIAGGSSVLLLILMGRGPGSRWLLVGALVIVGASTALAQVATNGYLAGEVAPERQGFALGLKQAAVPFAGLLGGLTVPIIGLRFGWRGAFVFAGCVTLSLCFPLFWSQGSGRKPMELSSVSQDGHLQAGRRPPLLALTVGGGLGIAASTALNSFIVLGAVDAGASPASAALLLASGAGLAGAARVLVGTSADRRGDPRVVASIMMAIGALGYLLLAFATRANLTILLFPSAAIAFAAGWGWNGLLNLAIVRANRDQTARATGVLQLGVYTGCVVGPVLFGVTITHASYAAAWTGAAAVSLCAATAIMVARWQSGPMPLMTRRTLSICAKDLKEPPG